MKINRALIFENIGAASMCWSETPSGVFQSEKAERLANEIVEHAEKVLQAERERSKILVEALEFYALGKVDHDSQEIRDFITGKIKFNYKIADVYGCVAREALEKYKVGGE